MYTNIMHILMYMLENLYLLMDKIVFIHLIDRSNFVLELNWMMNEFILTETSFIANSAV